MIYQKKKKDSLQGLNFVVTGTLKNFKNRSELPKGNRKIMVEKSLVLLAQKHII